MTLSNYFKEKEGFNRLFVLLKNKYLKTSAFKGGVTLSNITKIEAEDLSLFFRKKYYAGDSIKIRFSDFSKILKDTDYKDFDWSTLLDDYFKVHLIDSKTQKQNAQIKENNLYESLCLKFTIEEKNLFYELLNDPLISVSIHQKYLKEEKNFINDIYYLINFTANIKRLTPISLVMLSSKTGNPHFLDNGSKNQKLFFKMLSYKYQIKEPTNLYSKIEFLNHFNLSIDETSNNVLTYGLKSNARYINAFYADKQVLYLTLNNLLNVKWLDTINKNVFVFENPSMMCLSKYDIPIIITNGMPNYCVYVVIEMLIKNGNRIYYNGDYDPEGLIIADKLKEKFPSITLFAYAKKYYNETLSEKTLNVTRLNKLKKLKSNELNEIKASIEYSKSPAYQENNIQNIIKELEKLSVI